MWIIQHAFPNLIYARRRCWSDGWLGVQDFIGTSSSFCRSPFAPRLRFGLCAKIKIKGATYDERVDEIKMKWLCWVGGRQFAIHKKRTGGRMRLARSKIMTDQKQNDGTTARRWILDVAGSFCGPYFWTVQIINCFPLGDTYSYPFHFGDKGDAI